MPHAVIECSRNCLETVRKAECVAAIHRVMVECGLFDAVNIKTRLYCTDDLQVGTKGSQGSFVHVTISILAGRSIEQRDALAKTLLETIRAPLANIDQVTIDIREMVRETYKKSAFGV